MGSFSWMKADTLTNVANIVYDKPFKFLIPKEFGGGCIKDKYQDYGYLGTKANGEPKYDIYELLSFWNVPMHPELKYDGEFTYMKEIDEYTHHNRCLIGFCKDTDLLKYPPKLVSCSFKGTYEECEGFSYFDPEQGFYKSKRTIINSFPYLRQRELEWNRITQFINGLKPKVMKHCTEMKDYKLSIEEPIDTDLWDIMAPIQDSIDYYTKWDLNCSRMFIEFKKKSTGMVAIARLELDRY